MRGHNMYQRGRAALNEAALRRRSRGERAPVKPGALCPRSGRGRRIMGLAMVMALLPVAAWACAVCFEGDDALARGLNMSILFLMSMPFAIFGSIFGTVYITYKRAQRCGRKSLAWTQKESVQ